MNWGVAWEWGQVGLGKDPDTWEGLFQYTEG